VFRVSEAPDDFKFANFVGAQRLVRGEFESDKFRPNSFLDWLTQFEFTNKNSVNKEFLTNHLVSLPCTKLDVRLKSKLGRLLGRVEMRCKVLRLKFSCENLFCTKAVTYGTSVKDR
jgi:hypothetical protein